MNRKNSKMWQFGKKFMAVINLALLLIALIAGSQRAEAQDEPEPALQPDRGAGNRSAYSISDIENINLVNGNVNLSIPLASLPPIAGGKLSWTINANYNSKLWNVRSEKLFEKMGLTC